MEDIKTSIEKIFDQFSSDSLVYGNPKRLSYNYTPESASKKRKLSPNRPQSNNTSAISVPDDSRNTTSDSLNISLSTSSWDVRRLKADIIDYNTKITELKGELDSRNAVHKRMEAMYASKLSSLEKQLSSSESKLRESDKYLKHMRRREATSKEDLVKATNELAQYKSNTDDVILKMQQAKARLENELRQTQFESNKQIENWTAKYQELETNYHSTRDDLDMIYENNGQLQERVQRLGELETQCEVQRNDLARANRRVAELENEVAAFGDWKDMNKTFQQRVAKIPDLEKEIERLRRDNKNIRDTIGNKLMLEEEVHSLQSRLTEHEQTQKELVKLQTIAKSMETELRDYQTLARNHLGTQTVSPMNLRDRIEELVRHDVVLTSEKSSANSEQKSAAGQLLALQKERDTFATANTTLQTSLRYHKTSLHRVQKKLNLVAKERDCYKQLIDNYEKDLTISGATSDMNPDSQVRLKLDMLEKSIDGYKEIVATLERDLQMAKNLPDLSLSDAISAENYERFKKEMELLRMENERLSQCKKELELVIEHSSIKGAYNIDKFKVVHMSMNPSAEAQEQHKVELEKLQAEIERLRRKNRQLEQDHADLTVRMNNDTANITCDLKEISSLRDQLKSLESKYKHQKDVYKHASQEYREVCYMLFGYRVDRMGSNNFRVSSLYAESEHDYLNFRVSDTGSLDMLSNNYSVTLGEMVNTYLGEHGSLPAFLCTLNLELFNRTTMAIQH